MRPTNAILAMLAGGAAGCTAGPAYVAPHPGMPQQFAEIRARAPGPGVDPNSGATKPESLERWWTVFNDRELDSLIDRALKGNRDLKSAVSRIRQARAEREVAEGALLPEVDATAGINRSLGSKNVKLPLSALGGGAPPGGGSTSQQANRGPQFRVVNGPSSTSPAPSQPSTPPGGPNSPLGEGGLPGVTTTLYQAGFDAIWELDLFGGQRRAVEAADAEVAAQSEGAYGVQVTLLAEVATTYLELRLDQEREHVAERNVASQEKTWRIANDKWKEGLGTEADAARQLAQLLQGRTAVPPLRAAGRLAMHALATLIGDSPAALTDELSRNAPAATLAPELPVGVPSDLLQRRPDIRQAERELAESSAEIGVAAAQVYPQFSLTGSLGIDSSDLKHLPEWSSRYYSISPGIRWPILDWARLRAAVRVENEGQAQALLAYQDAVAQALKEVEDALVQYEFDLDRHTEVSAAVEAARRARDITAETYAQGLEDETATLEAERSEFQAEDALAQSEAGLRIDLVALYKALGGGWKVGG